MKYFRGEFVAHSHQKKCPAGMCRNLITVRIEPETCVGCGLCVEVCPLGAITGESKSPHRIDTAVCTRCGACRNICPTEGAVVSE